MFATLEMDYWVQVISYYCPIALWNLLMYSGGSRICPSSLTCDVTKVTPFFGYWFGFLIPQFLFGIVAESVVVVP
jgi:hypothetical protein